MTKATVLTSVMLTGAILLVHVSGLCASVGSLATDTKMGNVSGLGEVCTPEWPAMSFPDFLFYSEGNAYLIFGASYEESDWTDWQDDVKHYEIGIAMAKRSPWFGIWVAGLGDINDGGDNDLLIGDTRHLNYEDWDQDHGICYALYDIVEPEASGELNLDYPDGKATVVKIMTDQIQSRFGCCSRIVGDVNGDDYGDILIGESGWGPPTTATAYRERYECGRACLFYGSDDLDHTGTTCGTVTLLTGENRNDHFGAAVSTAGLLNDDEYADFAVGAPWFDKVSGETVTNNAGRVYIFLGSEDGITGTHATDSSIIITGETADSFFGSAIGSGDFDGDGQGDLVVGAYGYDGQTGRAYVFFASSLMDDQDGLVDAADADVIIDGEADEDLFGSSVSTAGEFFGQMVLTDGLIVGAPGVEDTKGAFYVFDMSSPPASAAYADYPIYGADEGDRVGVSVTNLEDVDGSGDSYVGVVRSGSENGAVLIHDED